MKHTLDYQIEKHPLQTVLGPIEKEEKKLDERIQDIYSHVLSAKAEAAREPKAQKKYERMQMRHASLERQIFVVRARRYAVEQEMLQDIVRKADVVSSSYSV